MIDILERRAVRALLLTPDNEILLIRVASPNRDAFWIAPGGGIEPGETVEGALRRELREEIGVEAFESGPIVWLRHHTFTWDGRRISQHEEYRIVRLDRFEAVVHDTDEARFSTELRWWPVGELVKTGERLTPRSLAQIVESYLRIGAPSPPPPEEVVVD